MTMKKLLSYLFPTVIYCRDCKHFRGNLPKELLDTIKVDTREGGEGFGSIIKRETTCFIKGEPTKPQYNPITGITEQIPYLGGITSNGWTLFMSKLLNHNNRCPLFVAKGSGGKAPREGQ